MAGAVWPDINSRPGKGMVDRALIVKPPRPLSPSHALERLRTEYAEYHPWGTDDHYLPQPGRPYPATPSTHPTHTA